MKSTFSEVFACLGIPYLTEILKSTVEKECLIWNKTGIFLLNVSFCVLHCQHKKWINKENFSTH